MLTSRIVWSKTKQKIKTVGLNESNGWQSTLPFTEPTLVEIDPSPKSRPKIQISQNEKRIPALVRTSSFE